MSQSPYYDLDFQRSRRKYLSTIQYLRQIQRTGKIYRLTRSQINAIQGRLAKCINSIRRYLKLAAIASGVSAIPASELEAQCRMNRLPISTQHSFTVLGGSYYSLGSSSTPTFVDLDNDGDYDLITSEFSGRITHYENRNGFFKKSYGELNPIQSGVGYSPQLAFVDIDNDGDMDSFIGDIYGEIHFFRNDNCILVEVTGSGNPFNNVDVGSNSAPAFIDMDGDNDSDVFIGEGDGTINYFRNDNGNFIELSGSENPFNGVDIGIGAYPTFVDIDADGDLDAFIEGSGIHFFRNDNGVFNELSGVLNPFDGESSVGPPGFIDVDSDGDFDAFLGAGNRTIRFFRNDNGVFQEGNGGSIPFYGVDVGAYAAATWGDLDGDNDDDIFIGTSAGIIKSFTNTNGIYTEVSGGSNPFDFINVDNNAQPALIDLDPTDSDGELDLFVGSRDGTVHFYKNNNGIFTEQMGSSNPLNGVDVGFMAAPTFVDFDGDNDKDAFIGNSAGNILYFRNNNGTFSQIFGEGNPFNGVDVGRNATPSIFRFDASQALVGNKEGQILEFKKSGNQYVPVSDSAYDGIDVGALSSPMLLSNSTFIGDHNGRIYVYMDQGGRSNVWEGPFTSHWHGIANSWELNAFPKTACDNVYVFGGFTLTVDPPQIGEARTLTVKDGGQFEVKSGAELLIEPE